MKLEQVPQDPDSTYGGHRKLLYAVDEQGHYRPARSGGWEAESYSTRLVLEDMAQQEQDAHAAWQRGEQSPLGWLMHRNRLDLPALAQVTGLWQWRLRRHLRPAIYRRLPARLLARYAEAFGLPLEQLLNYQKERP